MAYKNDDEQNAALKDLSNIQQNVAADLDKRNYFYGEEGTPYGDVINAVLNPYIESAKKELDLPANTQLNKQTLQKLMFTHGDYLQDESAKRFIIPSVTFGDTKVPAMANDIASKFELGIDSQDLQQQLEAVRNAKLPPSITKNPQELERWKKTLIEFEKQIIDKLNKDPSSKFYPAYVTSK